MSKKMQYPDAVSPQPKKKKGSGLLGRIVRRFFLLLFTVIILALAALVLVMNLIFVFFREAYAAANEVAVSAVYTFILTVIGINGVPEAIVAGILTLLIGRVLLKKNVRERLGLKNDIGY